MLRNLIKKKKKEKTYINTSELCILNLLDFKSKWAKAVFLSYFWGYLMSILHSYKELHVSLTELMKEKSFSH